MDTENLEPIINGNISLIDKVVFYNNTFRIFDESLKDSFKKVNEAFQKLSKSFCIRSAPTIETTHSCILEFPNGDIVKMPRPEGDNWEKSIIWDDFTEGDSNHWEVKAEFINSIDNGQRLIDDEEDGYDIIHKSGLIILKEYTTRIEDQLPEIIEIIEWSRIVVPTVKTESRYVELKKFPLLNGIEK